MEICGRDVTGGDVAAPRRRPCLYPPRIGPPLAQRRRRGCAADNVCDGLPSQRCRSPADPSQIHRRSPSGRARSSGASPPSRKRGIRVSESLWAAIRSCCRPRALAQSPALIAEQPSREGWTSARPDIFHSGSSPSATGVGRFFVSAELSEMLGLSGRVLVMFEGRHPGGPPTREGKLAQRRIAHGGARSEIRMSAFSGAETGWRAPAPSPRLRSRSASPPWSGRRSFSYPAMIR